MFLEILMLMPLALAAFVLAMVIRLRHSKRRDKQEVTLEQEASGQDSPSLIQQSLRRRRRLFLATDIGLGLFILAGIAYAFFVVFLLSHIPGAP